MFAPVPNLSLIVVDEEHDHSYKQEEMPRYHARDVAVMRAKMSNAAVVLGSATPSLETYYNALQGKYRLLEFPERIEKRPLPEVEVLDMREEFQRTKKDEVLSRKLVEEIGDRLERHEQVMVLAQPARLFGLRALPRVWRVDPVQELRHLHDLPQARTSAGLPLLRIHPAGAEDVPKVRQRIRAVSRHRLGEAGTHPARTVSAGSHRAAGSRHGPRPR